MIISNSGGFVKTSFLPHIETNFSDWYNEVILLSKLADYSPVKGCITLLPYGYALWEQIQSTLNIGIKAMHVSNMAFPLLIPYSLLAKEKDHIEGFSPEVALVTHAGGEKLEEPLVIRPTSEVIIHSYFKKWIKSWRDLPVKVNQWCSVVRWEKRPRPFIRTSEFWWQEGHTAHETYEEAKSQVLDAITLYKNFVQDHLCIPVFMGEKPPYERFAGADETWTIEGMMQDGKAVQMGTSHFLSQSFSTAIGISFQDRAQKMQFPFLTSWGVTTRLIGTLVMVHGDNRGLIFPPKIAPVQVIIIPILKKSNSDFFQEILQKSRFIEKSLLALDFRVKLVIDEQSTPGEKFAEAELQGIPFRIELGEKDIRNKVFTLFSRYSLERTIIDLSLFEDPIALKSFFSKHVNQMHLQLFQQALLKRNLNVFHFSKFVDFLSFVQAEKKNAFYVARWCGEEEAIFKDAGYTVRCFLDNSEEEIIKKVDSNTCCLHDNCTKQLSIVLIAKSY